MKKIPTLFKRNPEDMRHVLDDVTPGCEWVLKGEGVATRKYDGTCVMLDTEGRWWNRREIRAGKTMPADAIDLGVDSATGKHMVWVSNSPAGFQKQLEEAISAYQSELSPGTYELCGPNVDTRGGKNPEHLESHILIKHSEADTVNLAPGLLSYHGLGAILSSQAFLFEGIVWHHPDGRMAKLKKRDFS